MGRSLFQKPRVSFTGIRYRSREDDFEDDGDLWLQRRNVDFQQRRVAERTVFSRLPTIVKIIVLLFSAGVGVMAGAVIWLIVGGLQTPLP